MDEKGNSVLRKLSELTVDSPKYDENNNQATIAAINETLSKFGPEKTDSTNQDSQSAKSENTQDLLDVPPNINEITKQPSLASISSLPSCIFVNLDSQYPNEGDEEEESTNSTAAEQYNGER